MNVSIDLGSYLVVSSFLVLHLWGFIYQVTYMYALFRSTLILPSTVKSLHRFDISSAKDSYIVICLVSKGCRPEQVHSTSRTASISTPPTPPHHPHLQPAKNTQEILHTNHISMPHLQPSNQAHPSPQEPLPCKTLYSGPSSLHPSYPCPHPQSTLYPSPTHPTPQPLKNRKTCSKKPYHHHPTSTHPHSGTPNTHRRRCSRSGEPTWMREHQEITNVPNTRRRTDGDARGCVATR